jgi:spermidine synthase
MRERISYAVRGTKLQMTVEVEERLEDVRTPFQRIEIVRTPVMGRVLLLDGHVQLSDLDERAYHEALVHVPLLSMEAPESALVVGGGDGLAVRELARHPGIRRIEMVEIDGGVVEASKRHLADLLEGALDDPRVAVRLADAFEFVKTATGSYDLVVMDVTDVHEGVEGELSERLFTGEFYAACRGLLSPGGMLVTQADNPVFCSYAMAGIREDLARIFPKAGAYQALVPSFGGFSGFCWGSLVAEVPREWPGARGMDLAYLDPVTWSLAFHDLGFRGVPSMLGA